TVLWLLAAVVEARAIPVASAGRERQCRQDTQRKEALVHGSRDQSPQQTRAAHDSTHGFVLFESRRANRTWEQVRCIPVIQCLGEFSVAVVDASAPSQVTPQVTLRGASTAHETP